MNDKTYKFKAFIKNEGDSSFVEFPHDVDKEFGSGDVKVFVTYDGVPDECTLNDDDRLNISDEILKRLNKKKGDFVKVTVSERN